jgi:hypothetical protein
MKRPHPLEAAMTGNAERITQGVRLQNALLAGI